MKKRYKIKSSVYFCLKMTFYLKKITSKQEFDELLDFHYLWSPFLDCTLKDHYRSLLSQEDVEIIGLLNLTNDSLAGYMLISNQGEKLIINLLFVAENYRRQGGGRKLIQYAESFGKNLILWCNMENVEAAALYLRSGFLPYQVSEKTLRDASRISRRINKMNQGEWENWKNRYKERNFMQYLMKFCKAQ